MADGEYKLSELSELSGVPERTIRYYISKDLLPGPNRGSKSRYSDEHLARLRVIRKLQDVPLPLDVIRVTLNGLSSTRDAPSDSRDGVTNTDGDDQSGVKDDRSHDEPASCLPEAHGPADTALGYIKWAGSAAPTLAKKLRRTEGAPVTIGERSQWERLILSPDIEVHVRRPLTRSQNRALDQLMEKAQQIFGGGES